MNIPLFAFYEFAKSEDAFYNLLFQGMMKTYGGQAQ